jgi:hypothetical protein
VSTFKSEVNFYLFNFNIERPGLTAELLLGFLGTLPLALHRPFIPLRYVVIQSLHMLCDSFKSWSPGRRLFLASEN